MSVWLFYIGTALFFVYYDSVMSVWFFYLVYERGDFRMGTAYLLGPLVKKISAKIFSLEESLLEGILLFIGVPTL